MSKLKSNLNLIPTKIPKDFKDLSLPKFREVLSKQIVEKIPTENDPPAKINPILSSIGGRLGNDVALRIQTKMKNKRNEMKMALIPDEDESADSEKDDQMRDSMTTFTREEK